MPNLTKALEIDAAVEAKCHSIIPKEPSNILDKSPIIFNVHATHGYYIDLNEFYIDMELRLVNQHLIRHNDVDGADVQP